jgi:hypothetical protein
MMKNTWKIFSQTFLFEFLEIENLEKFHLLSGKLFAFLMFLGNMEKLGRKFFDHGNSIEKFRMKMPILEYKVKTKHATMSIRFKIKVSMNEF